MTETSRTRLPFRAGSIQMRRANYWAVFYGVRGEAVQINTHTANSTEALRICAQAVLPSLRAKLVTIEAIASGTGTRGYGLSEAQRAKVNAAFQAAESDQADRKERSRSRKAAAQGTRHSHPNRKKDGGRS